MTSQISWYNEDYNALLIRYEAGWTWKQHHALIAQLSQMRNERGITPFFCLFDLRGTTMPFDSSTGENYHNPREGSYIVIVIDNMFTRTIAQLAIRARGHQHLIHLVSTLEEGKAHIDAQIAKLKSSKNSNNQAHH